MFFHILRLERESEKDRDRNKKNYVHNLTDSGIK